MGIQLATAAPYRKEIGIDLFCLFSAFVIFSLLPSFSYAAGGNVVSVICGVVGIFQGSVGKAIATLAVVVLGLAGLFGKISPTTALVTAAGITLIFGAGEVVKLLFGKEACLGVTKAGIDASALYKAFCRLVNVLTGNTAMVIAALVVFMMGVGAIFGKISPMMATVVSISIALVFGAANILGTLGIGNAGGCMANGNNMYITQFDCYMCKFYQMVVYSGFAKALAAVGVAGVGIMALWGKMTPSNSTLVALGVALIFGGPSLFFHATGRKWLCYSVFNSSAVSCTSLYVSTPSAEFNNAAATMTDGDGTNNPTQDEEKTATDEYIKALQEWDQYLKEEQNKN